MLFALLASECWKDTWGPHNFARCCLDQSVASQIGCWDHLGDDADAIDKFYNRCCLNHPVDANEKASSDEQLILLEDPRGAEENDGDEAKNIHNADLPGDREQQAGSGTRSTAEKNKVRETPGLSIELR
ncbi:unnamed protein product, partial [Amoebophrya sp. A120]|eukprot:GSA120T00003893001.1